LQATCPDDAFRDGAQAVKNATKACELTDWKIYEDLGTLAAAYAEAGDYGEAAKWDEKALELAPAGEKDDYRSRLALCKANKPYRQDPTR
jgi:Flp pilus assembly protein TadD